MTLGSNTRGHDWGALILGASPGTGACGLGKILLCWGSASSQAFTDLARVMGLEGSTETLTTLRAKSGPARSHVRCHVLGQWGP